jgi:DNA-directed RNA polymerase specialized sigma24 family protein
MNGTFYGALPLARAIFMRDSKIQAVADDLVQDTFVKVIEKIHQYKGEVPVYAWIKSIGINCLKDYKKSKQFTLNDSGDDEWWDFLENSSNNFHAINPPITGDSLEDCFNRAWQEYAKEEPDRADTINYWRNEYSIKKIANLIQRTDTATKEYISQCKIKFEKFLESCRDYIPT